MQDELLHIPLASLRLNDSLLRTVNKESADYQGVKNSIRVKGVLNPISAREFIDGDGTKYWKVIDGAHRTEAARDLGLATIPAIIKDMTDAETIEAQIVGNVQKVDTKPFQYSVAMIKLLEADWTQTQAILAEKLGKTEQWIRERLNLGTLRPEIGSLVDEGKMNLANAYALAKLDADEQPMWVERACTVQTPEFVPSCEARRKQMEKDKRAGRNSTPATFDPQPFMRKQGEVLAELAKPSAIIKLLSENEPESMQDAALLALKWFMNIDPSTLAEREEKWKTELENKAKEQAAAKEQRDAKKRKEAKIRSDRIELQTQALKDNKSDAEVNAILKEYDDRIMSEEAAERLAAEKAATTK